MRKVLLAFIAGIGLVSCNSGVYFEENKAIPNHEWNQQDVVQFDVDIEDTLSPHHLVFNLRNGSNYPYANLYVFSETTIDSTLVDRDTLHFILADKSGKWLGNTGLGDIVEHHLLFKKDVRFTKQGTYSISFEQGMRDSSLTDVFDVGLRIVK